MLKNKLAKWQKRLWIIAFFIGFNIVLGSYFLMEVRADLPKPLATLLYNWGSTPRKVATIEDVIHPKDEQPDLAVEPLLQKINDYRTSKNLPPLKNNPQLSESAEILLEKMSEYDYDGDKELSNWELEQALKAGGYNYERVSHNSLAGPKTVASVMTAWFSDADQADAIDSDEFTDIGMATILTETKNNGQIGVTVQLLGKQQTNTNTKKQVTQNQAVVPPAKEIPDNEVIEALNSYRKSHGLYALKTHPLLCEYAEKRAQDLKKAGGLDGHAGFQKDFADQDNLPVGISDYPKGSKFTENLAHQYCKNMTTGESFVAQTGVALIEWCFDSSTKGHREAQLSNESENVCVRHADNMYVVIFGT